MVLLKTAKEFSWVYFVIAFADTGPYILLVFPICTVLGSTTGISSLCFPKYKQIHPFLNTALPF